MKAMKAKAKFWVAMMLALCLALTACGGGGGQKATQPSASTTGATTTSGAVETANAVETADAVETAGDAAAADATATADALAEAGEPAGAAPTTTSDAAPPAASGAEKVIRISRSWEDSSWDPATFTGADQLALTPEIFETLVRLENDGSYSPLLAQSWDASPDGLAFTFHLRQGAQFHHGYGELTAADVKFTFDRHADKDVGSIHIDNLKLDNLEQIETPDDYTVVFKLKDPDPDFLTRCSLYSSIIVSKAAFDDKGLEGNALFPIGTGPFEFDKGTPGQQTECVKFNRYWGPPAKVDRIINVIVNDTNTNYSAFENGELDAIFVYYLDKVNEYIAAGYKDMYMPSRQILYIGANMQIEPLDNDLVREAFFAALDPEYFISDLFYGTETFTGGYIPPTSKYALTGYMKSTYDPDKAKALLADAGYPNGAKVTMWSVNDDISPPPALMAQMQLKDAGFDLELQLVDFGVFIDKVRNGEAGMWLLYNSTPPIANDTISRYTGAYYPGSNWIGLQDETYDGLVAKGLAATTEEEKARYFDDAQKRLIDMRLLYPVCTYGYNMIMQPSLSGVELLSDNTVTFRNAVVNN